MCGIVWNMDPAQNLFNVVLTAGILNEPGSIFFAIAQRQR
jgi:hypothetical protein